MLRQLANKTGNYFTSLQKPYFKNQKSLCKTLPAKGYKKTVKNTKEQKPL